MSDDDEIKNIDGHTAVLYNDQIVLFGGYINLTEVTNKVYYYLIKKSQWVNKCLNCKSPKPRVDHSASLHEDKMYIFGGQNIEL